LFKLIVMQFRFINTPAIFQRRINYILEEYLDDFVMIYLNNIIVYLDSEREHKEYVKWVLNKLYKKNMLVAVKKYKFYIKKTNFIGFIIKLKQISIDLKKIIGLKSFLKFCNYYRKFIIKWLKKIKPFIKI